MEARTLNQVNKAIQSTIGNFSLLKGNGYFYVSSKDEKISLKLSSLYSTSIFVCYLNQQSLEDWLKDVQEIVSKIEKN